MSLLQKDYQTELKRIIDKGITLSDVKIIRGKQEDFRPNRRVRVIDDTDFRNCLLEFDGETYPVLSPFDAIFRIKKTASTLEVVIIASLFLYGFVSTFINIELLTNLRYEFSVSHGFALFIASAFLAFASYALTKLQIKVITIYRRENLNIYFAEGDPHLNEIIDNIDPTDPNEAVKSLEDLDNEFDLVIKTEKTKDKKEKTKDEKKSKKSTKKKA